MAARQPFASFGSIRRCLLDDPPLSSFQLALYLPISTHREAVWLAYVIELYDCLLVSVMMTTMMLLRNQRAHACDAQLLMMKRKLAGLLVRNVRSLKKIEREKLSATIAIAPIHPSALTHPYCPTSYPIKVSIIFFSHRLLIGVVGRSWSVDRLDSWLGLDYVFANILHISKWYSC